VQAKIANIIKKLAAYFNLKRKTRQKYPDKCDQIAFEASRVGLGKTAGRTGGESKIIRIVSSRYIVHKTNISNGKRSWHLF
jgi:hypothetical protein